MSPGISGLAGRWTAERDPRRHMIDDLRREKFILHLSQWMYLVVPSSS